ncbi:O-antigen ligase family protein [Hylemonella sp. W303a]|uniref:O-antigen ligase family protein n=1 Tax=Hylemonella sp. W303a TaxID=3389873 RepID=UPI00396AFEF9
MSRKYTLPPQELWRRGLLNGLMFSIFGILFLQRRYLDITDLLVIIALITVLMRTDTRQTMWRLFAGSSSIDLRWIAWPFLTWCLVISLTWLTGLHPSNYPHQTLRYTLALSLLALTLGNRPASRYLLWGLCVAAVVAAGQSAWDWLIADKSRAAGLMLKPIDFGNWSAFTGMLLILFAALASQWQMRWRIGALLLAILSLLACALSATRGSFLAIPVLAVFLLFLRKDRFHRWLLGLGLIATIIGSLLILRLPSLQEDLRLVEAKQDMTQATGGKNYATSIGARFVMWQSAWEMFKQHPITGVGPGSGGYSDELDQMLKKGELPPIQQVFNHAHSDIMHTLATSGLLGLIAYLVLIAGPLIFFGRALHRADADAHQRMYAAAGLLVVSSGLCFGLTDSNVVKHIYNSTYPLLICALAAQLLPTNQKSSMRGPKSASLE